MRRRSLQRLKRAAGAASCVRGSGRFVLNELRKSRSPVEREYRLRGSGLRARVRQPLLDAWVMEEVFRLRVYEPPPAAASVLAGLGRPPRILDLGGHVGLFGLFARELFPDSSVVSFEPDPHNGGVLRRCIESNGLERHWRMVEACAATAEGTVAFSSAAHLSRANPDAADQDDIEEHIIGIFPFLRDSVMFSRERLTVPTLDVFPYLAEADFAKIDIEGTEWELIADPRWRDIEPRVLVIEYHPGAGPGEEAETVLANALGDAGYEVGERSWSGRAGVIWAWRPSPS